MKKALSDYVPGAHPVFGDVPVTVDRVLFESAPPAQVSFIVPVHNQQGVIARNLDSIITCARLPHEICLIVDGCTDDSLAEIMEWLDGLGGRSRRTSKVVVAVSDDGIFETACDALGISLTSAEYVIEVQADMHIEHVGFDRVMTNALDENVDVFAVSGRGIHPVALVRRPGHEVHRQWSRVSNLLAKQFSQLQGRVPAARAFEPLMFRITGQAGRLGEAINRPLHPRTKPRVYVGGSVIRGPLAFRRRDYEGLDGFDLEHFFLGNDDHDLMFRAQAVTGRTGGYVPIHFSAPLDQGSTRKTKSDREKKRFSELKTSFGSRDGGSALFGPARGTSLARVRRGTRIAQDA